MSNKAVYQFRELNRVLLSPATQWAGAAAQMLTAPGSWLAQMPGAASLAAGYELFYRIHKSYEKPEFGIDAVNIQGVKVPVVEETVLVKPFCRLQHFKRHSDRVDVVTRFAREPVVLIVAPLSGHHATLLRDTVSTMLTGHDVYVTDWIDARMVPLGQGAFTLDDYVDYVREFIRHIGAERLNVMAVCQPTVPVLAAVALMAAGGEPEPFSLTLMGGPVDARHSPTKVNHFATTKPLDWFEKHLLHEVPSNYPGRGRRVYPGFLQHAGFVAMNPARHIDSHWDFYNDLVRGNLDDADEHRRFYDEYNAVLDMPAEYYMDCVRIVFQEHLLPRGRWHVHGERVAPETMTRTALFTIEGELDDVSGLGQTRAAHGLCPGIAAEHKHHMTVEGAGHYGVFSGRRWRETVYPRVREFIAAAQAAPLAQRRSRTA